MNKVFQSFKKYQETEESYTDVSISNMQNRVCDLLEEAQLKKVNLAKKVGIKKQQLNNFFDKGHNATLKTIGKIAHGLNKKVVISFVDKDVNNKDFYNHVQSYTLNSKNYEILSNSKTIKIDKSHVFIVSNIKEDKSSFHDYIILNTKNNSYESGYSSQEPQAS